MDPKLDEADDDPSTPLPIDPKLLTVIHQLETLIHRPPKPPDHEIRSITRGGTDDDERVALAVKETFQEIYSEGPLEQSRMPVTS